MNGGERVLAFYFVTRQMLSSIPAVTLGGAQPWPLPKSNCLVGYVCQGLMRAQGDSLVPPLSGVPHSTALFSLPEEPQTSWFYLMGKSPQGFLRNSVFFGFLQQREPKAVKAAGLGFKVIQKGR